MPSSCGTVGRPASAAVCIMGGARSFVQPHLHNRMHKSMRSLASHVDFFAVLSTQDNIPASTQEGWNFTRFGSTSDDAVLNILQRWPRIRAIAFYNSGDAYALANYECKGYAPRYIMQLFGWSTCMDQMEQAEAADGAQYEYVIRTRPDLYWRAVHPPLCAIGHSVLTHTPHTDQHFVLPRAVAPAVMRDMYVAYRHCDARHLPPQPELTAWLVRAAEAGCSNTARPCAVHTRTLPFALVRASADEPSARELCCLSCQPLGCAGCSTHRWSWCVANWTRSKCTSECVRLAYPPLHPPTTTRSSLPPSPPDSSQRSSGGPPKLPHSVWHCSAGLELQLHSPFKVGVADCRQAGNAHAWTRGPQGPRTGDALHSFGRRPARPPPGLGQQLSYLLLLAAICYAIPLSIMVVGRIILPTACRLRNSIFRCAALGLKK